MLKQPTVFADINDFANNIQASMYHTARLLEAASETTSQLPLTSLLHVCASSCHYASLTADSIRATCAEQA